MLLLYLKSSSCRLRSERGISDVTQYSVMQLRSMLIPLNILAEFQVILYFNSIKISVHFGTR